MSGPFVPPDVPTSAYEMVDTAGTAYHALYAFHASRAADPRVVAPVCLGSARDRLAREQRETREATVDIGMPMRRRNGDPESAGAIRCMGLGNLA